MNRTAKLMRLARRARRAIHEPDLVWRRLKRVLASTAYLPGLNRLDFNASYRTHVANLMDSAGPSTALEEAVGGQFAAFGRMQRDLLVSVGLGPADYVVDVGCGSGRLVGPLSAYLTEGRYLGLDVVPELVARAQAVAGRPDWRFEVTDGLKINERSGRADFVCFFSVFTHLLHEESFVYLEEAKRVLRPGGKVLFSFLEFQIPSHWAVFADNVRDVGSHQHLNQFMSRDGIAAWAQHLGFTVESISDGDKPHIPLTEPVVLDDGTRVDGLGNLGQSVCVLVRDA